MHDSVDDPTPIASDAYAERSSDTECLSATDACGNEILPPLRRIILPQGCQRHQAVAVLSQKARPNEYGFPLSYIRSDLLPTNLATITEDDVERASEGLFYHEGYPQLRNGKTFWGQLPHEPLSTYLIFQEFLEQAEELGIRQLDLLAQQQNMQLEQLQPLYYEYYWAMRAKAYDVFQVAAEQKRRQLRTRKMENKHYTSAGNLFDQLLERFVGEYADWTGELNAKEAIEALETLVKIQRLSLGLTGNNASSISRSELPAGADTESIIRNLARNANMTQTQEGNFMDKLRALTENPEDGLRVQEAILRIGFNGNGGSTDVSGGFQDQMGLS